MKKLHIALWVAQALVSLNFLLAAAMKLLMPVAKLAAMMPWTGEVSTMFLRSIGAIDLLGGIGIILPSLTRIRPRLTVFAAIGCSLLMANAIVFHFSRGEGSVTPFNFFLLSLSIFVAWGRGWKCPIAPRAAR